MTHLSQLTLSDLAPNQVLDPISRKRLALLRKLDRQIDAAEAQARDEAYVEEVRKWVRDESGERKLVTTERPIRKWWWQHGSGVWVLTLRDGTKRLDLGEGQMSIRIGELENLPHVLQTVREAILAGELDAALEASLKERQSRKNAKVQKAKRG